MGTFVARILVNKAPVVLSLIPEQRFLARNSCSFPIGSFVFDYALELPRLMIKYCVCRCSTDHADSALNVQVTYSTLAEGLSASFYILLLRLPQCTLHSPRNSQHQGSINTFRDLMHWLAIMLKVCSHWACM